MRPRYIVLAVIALALALGCFRLSKWQLDRRAQRLARNEYIANRLATPPAAIDAVPSDTAEGHYRRVSVVAQFDYAREFALALRPRDGSPGVYILTPARLPDGRALLVNRGWVYAADGMTVDLTRWREADTLAVEGFTDTFVETRGNVTMPDRPQLVRRLVQDSLTQRLGNSTILFPFVLVVTSPVSQAAPARLAPPPLTEGSHLSYTIQWAAFGVIAIVGMVLALRRGVTERRTSDVAPSAVAG
jgi:cytochrome oxidase assembly protein ShyY1